MVARPIRPKAFGPYRLCGRLAAGGMGTVYIAQHEVPNGGLVALKRIHEHLTEQPKFVKMFLDEAAIAAEIDHPNVCPVLDHGEIDGTPYLTMPLVYGERLGALADQVHTSETGPTSNWYLVLAKIIADAARGLHAAHELSDDTGRSMEVVHRDVSPHNLLVGYDGVTHVLDFGVASARVKLASTATGEVRGKFAYMAPEHLDGIPLDRRADVWSLGVVLWEAITGQRLFKRPNATDTVEAVLAGAIPGLSEYRLDVPLDLEEIVFRALARDRRSRFRSALELAKELELYIDDHGYSEGSVRLAMGQLFPQGRERQEELVNEALQGIPNTDGDVTPVLGLPAILDDAATTLRESWPPKRPWGWVAIAGVLAGGGAVLWLYFG